MNQFLNQFMRICHPETHEIITNIEHAYQDGEITRDERNELIKAAIAAETENIMLADSAATIDFAKLS